MYYSTRDFPVLHVSQNLLKLTSIESVMPSNHLILCCPLLLLPSVFPSKYWSFSFSISPSNEYSGLISFRIDWMDLLAVQGTLKSLLPHHSLKTPIFRLSAFFMVQLSHPYMTTGGTTALTTRTMSEKLCLFFKNSVYVCHSFSS